MLSCDIIDDIEDILKQDKNFENQSAESEEISRGQNKSFIVPKSLKKNKENVRPDEEALKQGNAPGVASIYVKTWGCTHNNSDSEYMAGQLAAYGYNLVGRDTLNTPSKQILSRIKTGKI